MPTTIVPYLCGGTFFCLLLQSRKERSKARNSFNNETDGLSDVEIMKGLIQIVTSSDFDPYDPSFKKSVSQYKSCQINGGTYIPFTDETIIANFDNDVKNKNSDTLKRMSEFVNKFISDNSATWLVSALIEVIENDSNISEDAQFFIDSDMILTKRELRDTRAFDFQPFLLAILHFIILNRRENKIGRATFEVWFKRKSKNSEWIFQSDIGKAAMSYLYVEIVSDNDNIDLKYKNYLKRAQKKYSIMKTLLYSDFPRQFYDFYVCNDITQRIPNFSAGRRNEYRFQYYHSANAETLAKCSKFIILSGTGGLGKSMMLRHLMLDSILRYNENEQIPIFIPLKEYDENADDLLEYVFEKFTTLERNMKLSDFVQLLLKGKCLLLFDGLDEISFDYMKKFEHALEIFADSYDNNMFIISSRPFAPLGTFTAFNKFTVLRLEPFNKAKALELIDKLDFRADEPLIKQNFRKELNEKLYITHREFIENPLLLTIMLMTYEQFAEIPSKMHVFYHEAYVTLSQKHDASKGAYKRKFRTGLTADVFADYFAEFCARTYIDDKFDLNEIEFEKYFNSMNVHKKYSNHIKVDDFLSDLTVALCLMYYESGKYHFVHRSFQEYFCAVFFSKQKDKNLYQISQTAFENRRSKSWSDRTFDMLYDMIPEKIEEYVFLPFLKDLFAECDKNDGYLTFLKKIYPSIYYDVGEVDTSYRNTARSFIYNFIVNTKHLSRKINDSDIPFNENLISSEYAYINKNWRDSDKDTGEELIDIAELDDEYISRYGDPEVVGWNLEIDIEDIFELPEDYGDIIAALTNENFALNQEYRTVKQYLRKLQKDLTPKGDDLFDLL